MQPKFDQTKRSYPNLPADTHPDVRQAINDLHDYTYQLRSENQKLRGDLDDHKKAMSKPKFTGDIQGIKIKAPTDPRIGTTGSLANGDTIRYNSSTGQFEFGS